MLSIAESLTNIIFAPLKDGLRSVSLSANWMWPCRNEGEDARLYDAVEACSNFAVSLGINIPTGKDSLSMTQKYGTDSVLAPGTVIISAAGEVSDVKHIVGPVIVNDPAAPIYYIDFSFCNMRLGGSALAQCLGYVGDKCPTCTDADYFATAFDTVQDLIKNHLVIAGHDISAGGMLTALLEMCFANTEGGLLVDLSMLAERDIVKILFAENPGILVQVRDEKRVSSMLQKAGIAYARIATPIAERTIHIEHHNIKLDIDALRDLWYRTSFLLDRRQSGESCAYQRYSNYKQQPLHFTFPNHFAGTMASYGISAERRPSGIKAAIIREKGTNGDREMAYSLYLAGFDVKDVHMTDLESGREDLSDVHFIVFCGGFSNSDVLGSAKGWAGGFRYNERARRVLNNFYQRHDTLSLGVCNGCQLMMELGLIMPDDRQKPRMLHNDSHKFESNFVSVVVPSNHSVMFGSLAGSRLGIWVAHGEGKFCLPEPEEHYHIVLKYAYHEYPANPNGSDYDVAGLCTADGRHLAMMPHLERAIFPWQWGYYLTTRQHQDQITPWIEAFVNARRWVESHKKS